MPVPLAARIPRAVAPLLLLALRLPAQGAIPPATGLIDGRVIAAPTQQPVAGASVRVPGTAYAIVSGEDGRFRLRAPVGVVRLEVRAIGFAPIVRPDVVVSAGKATTLTLELQPRVTQLATVDVAPTYFAPSKMGATSTQSFSAEEVRRYPGVQEDVVRAVSVLPGVGITQPGRNDLVVRGGAPFENLFVVDNIEVPNINHFGTQGSTGGPISLINIDFVQDASLSAGGFGVRYGDRTASVTNIALREGQRERIATELNLSATGAGVIVEGPAGGRGSFLLGVRRSYLDLIFQAAGFAFVPSYADLTLKVVQRPSARDEVSAVVVGGIGRITLSADDADARFDNSRVVFPSQDQYFSGLTWKRLLSRGVVSTTLGRSWTRYRTAQRDSSNPPVEVFRANSTEGETSLRVDASLQLSPRVELEAGTIAKYGSALEYDVLLPGTLRRDAAGVARPLATDTSFTTFRQGVYGQSTLQLTDRLRATVGLRGDWYAFLNDAAVVAPRGALAFAATPQTTLTLAGGRYYQAPQAIWLVGDPGNLDRLRPLRVDQVVAGVQRALRPDTKVQLEVYAKRYADYPGRLFRPDAVLQPTGFDDATTDIPFGLEPLDGRATGSVQGVELFLQKRLSEVPVYGLVSASYNRTRFTGLTGRSRIGAFDTPVIVNALLGWRPNARWELSGRVRAGSGLPTTPFITTGVDAGRLDFTRYNAGERLPAFAALDVRIDRRFTFKRSQLVTYLDVQNATGRANVSGLQWNPRLRAVERNTSIGVLPSIGVNWEF